MLIEFVSKTADGRTAPLGANREEGRRGERNILPSSSSLSLSLRLSGSLARSPFLSFPFAPHSILGLFGSHGGKACIIRRNSTGITLVRIPSSHPAAALLCRATNLFNRFSVVHEAAPLLGRSP